MKVIFFASGAFAVPVLDAVRGAGHNVSLVVTQPDRKKGRHLLLTPTPIKTCALSKGLSAFDPEDIHSRAAVEILKKQEADIFVVVSYGKILKKTVLELPGKMCLNIHASVLPRYRGAAPVNYALMRGENKTGVTFIRMNEFMDQGDIIFKRELVIAPLDNALSLKERLSSLAAECTPGVLADIETNRVSFEKQVEEEASYAPLMKKDDGLISWKNASEEIYNQYRGCFGWPGTFTFYKERLLKIIRMAPGKDETQGRPGEIVAIEDGVIEVASGKGTILIHELQPESHKAMSVRSFLSGRQVRLADVLGK